ncbi:345_t:CDS:1 [Acaulospora morrowiae]|uniref:345_t:CDS:1 n=1 Tax=Acaulospora morrowiae TaxID=94023 RepID=A0A9N9AYR7_9GLOM|nr:345_t:CDS:1 [Acaulospora morrowiae]
MSTKTETPEFDNSFFPSISPHTDGSQIEELLEDSIVSSEKTSDAPMQDFHQIDSINIFDFDGTLFASPQPNPRLWENALIGLLKNDQLYKGWYQSKKSLDFEEHVKSRVWNNWWNEKVVDLVRNSMAHPNSLTILLTGRKYSEFHEVIAEMTSRKGLTFDVMGFKPDQDILDWSLYYNPAIIGKVGRTKYEEFTSMKTVVGIPITTKNFKVRFIEDLLSHHPSTKLIVMWEDRKNHVKAFQSLLNELKCQEKILQGKVNHVILKMRYLDMNRERRIVNEIIEDHNKNSSIWDTKIELVRRIKYAGIYFDYEVIQSLRRHFSPPNYFMHNQNGYRVNYQWKYENPHLFIQRWPLSQNVSRHCSSSKRFYVVMKVVAKGMFKNSVYCLKVMIQDQDDVSRDEASRCLLFDQSSPTFIMLAFDQRIMDGFPNRPENIEPYCWTHISEEQQICIRGFVNSNYLTDYRDQSF